MGYSRVSKLHENPARSGFFACQGQGAVSGGQASGQGDRLFQAGKAACKRLQWSMTRLTAITDQMHPVSSGEFQGDVLLVKPRDPARIFTLELSIHTDNACLADGKLRQQAVVMHKRATEGDVPDGDREIVVSQFQNTDFAGIEPFMQSLFFNGAPPDFKSASTIS
jgi:hypothetical protein